MSRVLPLLAGAALAAVQALPCAAQPAAPPLYQVEVIAFAYSNPNPAEELFQRETAAEAAADLAAAQGQQPLEGAEASDSTAPAGAEDDGAPGAGPGSPQAGAAGSDATAPPGAAAPDAGASADGSTAPSPGASADGAANPQAPASERPLVDERGFRVLDSSAYKLGAAYAKLEKLGAYRPLLHAAWLQPALPENQAKAVTTADLGAENPTGAIELYASRYLHVNVNLRYHPTPEQSAALAPTLLPAPSVSAAAPADGVQNGGALAGPQPSGTTGPQSFGAADPQPLGPSGFAIDASSLGPSLTIKASRRVAAGELQYFDHPYFGLLVLVTPYEAKGASTPPRGVAPSP